MTPRARALFAAYVLGVGIVAGRVAILVHELVGHLLVARLLGGAPRGARVTLAGGGLANHGIAAGWTWQPALVSAGGILVNLLVGLVALVAIRRRVRPAVAVFLAALAAATVLPALDYCAWGLYTGEGDPGNVVRVLAGDDAYQALREGATWWWVPFALAVPVASFGILRAYLPTQDRLFPCRTSRGRAFTTATSIGVAVLVLGVGTHLIATYHGGQAPAGFHATAASARRDALWGRTIRARLQVLRAGPPQTLEATQASMRAWLAEHPPEATPIPFTWPLEWLIPLLGLAGACLAIVRHRPESTRKTAERLSPRANVIVWSIAAALLGGLALTGEVLRIDPKWTPEPLEPP